MLALKQIVIQQQALLTQNQTERNHIIRQMGMM